MPITAMWSPLHGACTTANTLALAVCLAEGHDVKTLVTQTHFSLNNLELPLIGRTTINQDTYFSDFGLDTATMLYKSNRFEKVVNATIPIGPAKDASLFLLPGTTQTNRETFDNAEERLVLKKVLRELGRYYSAVLIDANAGYGDQTQAVLEAADNIVICLRQNKRMIEEVLDSKMIQNFMEKEKNIFFLFGEYDDRSKMSLSNIRKMFRSAMNKMNIGAIPYDVGYRDSISDCTAYRYLLRTIDLTDEDLDDGENWWYEVDQFAMKLI